MQLGKHWFVREPGFKLNEAGELFDMSDAPYTEKLVASGSDTDQSKAARQRLTAALAELNPSGGKTDQGGGGPRAGARRRRNAAQNPAAPVPAAGAPGE